ncbi:MAG: hypothetical protein HYZ54_13055 [Ignavibacteriae bacterium]|nr:hypothetical protein [Ignavibacteriota bacterium]
MRTDAVIKQEGFVALSKMLDLVEAERFITLIKRDNSDYTEWRKTLWENESIASLSSKAMESWEQNNPK